MQKRGLSQEGLKLIACMTMLIDHIGAVIIYECFISATGANKGQLLELYEMLRLIGRISFPIFCFLLVEGCVHSRNPKRYGMRLLFVALLSEVPYDLAIYGELNWHHQSVMVTLLLGFFMLEVQKKCPKPVWKLLAIAPFAVLAEWLHTDYGAEGIFVIALFALTREMPHKLLLQFLGLWCIFSPNHLMALNWLGKFSITVQEWAVFAAVPIAFYDGRKATKSKAIQWTFYLFYPAHLLVLYLIRGI